MYKSTANLFHREILFVIIIVFLEPTTPKIENANGKLNEKEAVRRTSSGKAVKNRMSIERLG